MVLLLPDLPPDVTFTLLPKCGEAFRFSFEAKRAALGPHIVQHWGWDEKLQLDAHHTRFHGKPFFSISHGLREVGTVSVIEFFDHIRFGEFYLFPNSQRNGLGTRILKHCLAVADKKGKPVRLEYLKWNPVGSLYERHGFVVVGETEIHWLLERQPSAASAFEF
jgi:GNAT superfamily N-acetyltransferase